MENILFLAVALGALGGGVAGVVAGRFIASALSRQFHRSIPAVRTGALAGGGIALLPTAFLAFVVGGTAGGGWGEAFIGSAGVIVGLALGIAVVLSVGLVLGAVAGTLVAILLLRLFGGTHAT